MAVLDFQSNQKPRDYLARRGQWRLLGLVLGLGLVFIVGEWVVNPEKRRQLMNMAGGALSRNGKNSQERGIDNLLAADAGRTPADDTPAVLAPADPDEAKEDETGKYFRGIKPYLLKSIQDDTAYRSEEDAAWFNLFDVLRKNKEADIDKASPGKVSYAQLFRQSAEYRGAVVTVKGVVRRVTRLRAAANDLGVEHYYQCWLAPVDNPTSPLVVCCLELPDGFPNRDGMAEDVEVTGFFFKRWAYRDKEGASRTAPTVVAKSVTWQHRPDFSREKEPPNPTVLFVVGAAALLTSIALAMLVYRQMRPRPLQRSRSAGRATASSLPVGPPSPPENRDERSSP